MPLINCPSCGRQTSDVLQKCKYCKGSLSQEQQEVISDRTANESLAPSRKQRKVETDPLTFDDEFLGSEIPATSDQLIQYPKANLSNRFIAAILDLLIIILLNIPLLLVKYLGQNDHSSHRTLFYLTIIPLYYSIACNGFKNGQSWGKKALGLMVVNLRTNLPCNKVDSSRRWLISELILTPLYLISYLFFEDQPSLYANGVPQGMDNNVFSIIMVLLVFGCCFLLIDPLTIILTKDGRKLGDRATFTQVINKEYYYQVQYWHH